jgi:D-3-phosphoglycerate dehydrogenase
MNHKTYFVIDFDSTFTKVEALDELCDIIFSAHEAKELKEKVARITQEAMEGNISLREALIERIELLNPSRHHIEILAEVLKEKISDSILRNQAFFEQNKDRIYIISNGFREFIVPVVKKMGIPEDKVFANHFLYDEKGNISGIDTDNPLSESKGKVQVIKDLQLDGEVVVIGDGYTDYEIKEAGLAATFYAFTENISRPAVVGKADRIAPSFDEVLFSQNLQTAISYPKNRIKVLLLENIHPTAVEMFQSQGFSVETAKEALGQAALAERISEVSILGIRSKTQVSSWVLEKTERLLAIGAFCIGTNQIDLNAASLRGVAVFNAPFSNTRSVVEMTVCEMIALLRQIPEKSAKLHQGIWDKSADGSHEIRGKVLGIVGYGSIGSQLSVVAEALGMKVLFFDLEHKLALGNAQPCASLEVLLSQSDIVSLHVDGRAENTSLISRSEISKMKDGAFLLNLSRGHVVDVEALADAVKSKKLAGAALDVFPYEPGHNDERFVSLLQNLPNVILTPHIGGSTLEAQKDIATFVPNKLMDYINTGNSSYSVNFPGVQLSQVQNAHRLLHIHHNQPGVLAQINRVLAAHQTNIVGQYLKTNEKIGYSITDINKAYSPQVIADLKAIENTIKFRVLY